MKSKNNIVKSIGRMAAIIGVAALALAAGRAKAADMQYLDHRLTNTFFLTPYTSTNYLSPFNAPGSASAWPAGATGPTNTYATATQTNNATVVYTNGTALPVIIMDLQNVPVYLGISADIPDATSATTNGSVTVQGSLSHDGIIWQSNAFGGTFVLNQTNPTGILTVYPLINGTNIFTGMQYARWDYCSTTVTNFLSTVTNNSISLVISNLFLGAIGSKPL